MESSQPSNLPTTPVVWHQIVRKPFQDCSGFVMYLADKCQKLLCGQHEEDEDIKTTHCHIMMVEPSVTDQAIAKARKKHDIIGAGNSLMKVTEKTREPYDEMVLGAYITKGDIDNIVSYSGYNHHQIVLFVNTWVPREKYAEIKKKESNSLESKKKKDNTHWDLIERVWKQLQDTQGIWDEVLEFNGEGIMKALNYKGRDAAFDMLSKELNRCKVRTSRNELERFYVTLLRFDRIQVGCMKEAILKNVFR